MNGISLDDINFKSFMICFMDSEVLEVIVVINVIVDGEVIFMYFFCLFKLVGIKVMCLV